MFELLRIFRHLKYSGLAFLSLTVVVTIGFYFISGQRVSWVDAFYMMGLTLTTIGFHEVIDLTDNTYGKIFTILFSFSGFGIITYFFSNLVALLAEGDLRKAFTLLQMKKSASKMEDHYIICGYGRVGKNIASEVKATGANFVIADKNENLVKEFTGDFPNHPYILGDCTDERILQESGIDRAKGLFVTTGDDNINLVICLTARQINPTIRIVARSMDLIHTKKIKHAGANVVISPTYIGGVRMAAEMIRPKVTHFIDEMMYSDQSQRLEEWAVTAKYVGLPLESLPLYDLKETLVIAIKHGDKWVYRPEKNTLLQEGDHMIYLTNRAERSEVIKRLN